MSEQTAFQKIRSELNMGKFLSPVNLSTFCYHIKSLSENARKNKYYNEVDENTDFIYSKNWEIFNGNTNTGYSYIRYLKKENIIEPLYLKSFINDKGKRELYLCPKEEGGQTYIFYDTYPMKKLNFSVRFKVNQEKLMNLITKLDNYGIKHNDKFILSRTKKKELPKNRKPKTLHDNTVTISADQYRNFTKYNPELIAKKIEHKYHINQWKEKLEKINESLPIPLQGTLDLHIKHCKKNNDRLAKISIRLTNSMCNGRAKICNGDDILFEKLQKEQGHKKVKQIVMERYNLHDFGENDIKSEIPRLQKSISTKKWINENHDIYGKVADKLCKEFHIESHKQSELREAIKMNFLPAYFSHSPKLAYARLKGLYEFKNKDEKRLENLSKLLNIDDTNYKERLSRFCNVLFDEMNCRKTLSNEVFWWESVMAIELMKRILKDNPDEILWNVYDCCYSQKNHKFRKMRKEIFEQVILPEYNRVREYEKTFENSKEYKSLFSEKSEKTEIL